MADGTNRRHKAAVALGVALASAVVVWLISFIVIGSHLPVLTKAMIVVVGGGSGLGLILWGSAGPSFAAERRRLLRESPQFLNLPEGHSRKAEMAFQWMKDVQLLVSREKDSAAVSALMEAGRGTPWDAARAQADILRHLPRWRRRTAR